MSNNSPSNIKKDQNMLLPLATENPHLPAIEYFLRLSLQASTARISSAWEISNPQLTHAFERRTRGLLAVDSWLEVNSKEEEEELIRKGVEIEAGGYRKFKTGKLDLKEGAVKGKRLVLCKVAIGRALNAQEKDLPPSIPEGYDSLLIDGSTYDYLIRDVSQVRS